MDSVGTDGDDDSDRRGSGAGSSRDGGGGAVGGQQSKMARLTDLIGGGSGHKKTGRKPKRDKQGTLLMSVLGFGTVVKGFGYEVALFGYLRPVTWQHLCPVQKYVPGKVHVRCYTY